MNKCKDCKYWERLTDNTESWGICLWFGSQEIKAPFWVKTYYQASGAISPDRTGCPTWEALKPQATEQDRQAPEAATVDAEGQGTSQWD